MVIVMLLTSWRDKTVLEIKCLLLYLQVYPILPCTLYQFPLALFFFQFAIPFYCWFCFQVNIYNTTAFSCELLGLLILEPVRVNRPKTNNKPKSKLYISNLSYNTTESDLTAAFSGCTRARIMTFSDSGRCRG